jgi:hypothetical protein
MKRKKVRGREEVVSKCKKCPQGKFNPLFTFQGEKYTKDLTLYTQLRNSGVPREFLAFDAVLWKKSVLEI